MPTQRRTSIIVVGGAWREPGDPPRWRYISFPRAGDRVVDFHGTCAAADDLAERLLASRRQPGEYPYFVLVAVREVRARGIQPITGL